MKVKMIVSMASPDWSYNPGDEVEVDAKAAKAWIEAGMAEPVKEEYRTATAPPRQTTSKKASKK